MCSQFCLLFSFFFPVFMCTAVLASDLKKNWERWKEKQTCQPLSCLVLTQVSYFIYFTLINKKLCSKTQCKEQSIHYLLWKFNDFYD